MHSRSGRRWGRTGCSSFRGTRCWSAPSWRSGFEFRHVWVT